MSSSLVLVKCDQASLLLDVRSPRRLAVIAGAAKAIDRVCFRPVTDMHFGCAASITF